MFLYSREQKLTCSLPFGLTTKLFSSNERFPVVTLTLLGPPFPTFSHPVSRITPGTKTDLSLHYVWQVGGVTRGSNKQYIYKLLVLLPQAIRKERDRLTANLTNTFCKAQINNRIGELEINVEILFIQYYLTIIRMLFTL